MRSTNRVAEGKNADHWIMRDCQSPLWVRCAYTQCDLDRGHEIQVAFNSSNPPYITTLTVFGELLWAIYLFIHLFVFAKLSFFMGDLVLKELPGPKSILCIERHFPK